MTTEIQARLRDASNWDNSTTHFLLGEAADEIDRLRKALAWYGDEGNYAPSQAKRMNHRTKKLVKVPTAVQQDKGQRAREALKQ